MASSTAQPAVKTGLESKFKQGLLYSTPDEFVYIYTDEDTFVVVHNPAGRKLGTQFEREYLTEKEEVSPFTGSVTLTED